MAYPPAYVRAYSFTDFETLNPGEPKPGDKLDTEYDAVSNALTATQTNLALIQRADGALANDSVGADQLQDDVFDGIVDGVTADAEAAAAAAAASAALAASSASAADTSAADATTQAGLAAGSAAQAGISQSIAQGAAVDAADSAAQADTFADVAVAAANDTAGSVAATEAAVQRAFEWAELLTGPVLPAPPGWPEAVDDGMFSSKWWAIRAREYNSVDTIDLGTAGADIGEAFDIWDAIPGNDLGPGLTYATWGTPTQTYVLVDRGDPSDPASWVNITGGPGPAGPGNTLTIGTVTTGAVGQPADATITGASPNQVLNLTLPTGATGPAGSIGPAGPPNALSIGTVTTVPDGTPSAANITGTAPTQVLNLTLTAGPQGIQGPIGPVGPAGPAVNLANPTGVIGLTAVNGVATTAPRSDSSPALSQAITPTWTGLHNFTSTAGAAGGAFQVVSNTPTFVMWVMSQAPNARAWYTQGAGTNYTLGIIDDGVSVVKQALVITRAVTTVTNLAFGNATDNPTYNFLGTGITSFSGNINLTNSLPRLFISNTAAGTDAKVWELRVGATGSFSIISDTDAFGGVLTPISITRSGVASNPTITFDALAYNFLSAGVVTSNGVHRGPDGSAGAPTYSFTSDPNSGMYLVSADRLGWSTGGLIHMALGTAAGTVVFSLDVPIWAPDGSAAAPSYSFTADQDTGIYLAAANIMDFATGGVARFRVSDAGVMTFAPFGLVDGSAATPALFFINDPDTGFYRHAVDEIGVARGGARRFVFSSDLQYRAGARTLLYNTAETFVGVLAATGTDLEIDARSSSNGIVRLYAGSSAYIGLQSVTIAAQPVWLADGSVGAPSLSFASDSDTGMFRYAADVIAFSVGGVGKIYLTPTYLQIDSTQIQMTTGGVSAPSYSFSGDPSTGIYRLGAAQVGVAVGAVYAGGWKYAGGNAQYLAPDGSGGLPSISFELDPDTGMYRDGADSIAFATAGVARFLVRGSGNVSGVDMSAPSFTTTSSRAIKRETGSPSKPANILARLRPLMYRLLAGDDREQLGLIAEEVHEVCPQLSDGKTVSYDRLAILLLAAWQEEHLEAA